MRSFKYCMVKNCYNKPAEGSSMCKAHEHAVSTKAKRAPKLMKGGVLKPTEHFTSEEMREVDAVLASRPKTRSECPDSKTPCPYLSCRYHLWMDLSASGMPMESAAFGDLDHTCALNFVDQNHNAPSTLHRVAKAIHTTRQRVDQVVQMGQRSAKARFGKLLHPFLAGDYSSVGDQMGCAHSPVED